VNLPALRAALDQVGQLLSPTASDDSLLTDRPANSIAAAVLLPIVLRAEPTILLTERTSTLSAHAGQVCLPGGRIEPTDPSPRHAALREAHEEIGLAPGLVEVVGHLPEHLTGTGYHITPVVGVVAPGFTPRPDPYEVAAVFELPLSVLLDPQGLRRERREFKGRLREYWVVAHPTQFIWGATAAILVNFSRLLRAGV
jgi:8-oxo-dGTP pyrophosphatase MutT (NUDIX family)